MAGRLTEKLLKCLILSNRPNIRSAPLTFPARRVLGRQEPLKLVGCSGKTPGFFIRGESLYNIAHFL